MTTVKRIKRAERNPEERQTLISMIINGKLLDQIGPITKIEYFKTPFAQTVIGWVLEHWHIYKSAPGQLIEKVFKEKEDLLDPDQADLIRQFLENLSEEHENGESYDTEYNARQAEKYFKRRAYELLQEEIKQRLLNGDIDGAEEVQQSFIPPTRQTAKFVNPWSDEVAIIEAFENQAEPLIKLPRALGEAWNSQFTRDALIGILAPEKRGKTWLLMYLARLAVKQKRSVAFFAVGDMTQPQMIRRFGIMEAKKSDKEKYCQQIIVPVPDCLHNQTGECENPGRFEIWGDKIPGVLDIENGFDTFEENSDWVPCSYCLKDKEFRVGYHGLSWMKIKESTNPLTWRQAIKNGRKMLNKSFRLSCHSTSTMNIKGIRSILTNWKTVDDWEPDIILIDYADILAPEDFREEFRHRQNTTWKAMRALSQDENCLVITATQADAASYDAKTLTASNFSEDKRKYAHVTGIMTLNQTPEEKPLGVMRIGQMFLREDEFDVHQTVTVLQSLKTGQPVLTSYWTPKGGKGVK